MILFQQKRHILFLKFTFVTLFLNLIEPYFHDSILKEQLNQILYLMSFIILEISQPINIKKLMIKWLVEEQECFFLSTII